MDGEEEGEERARADYREVEETIYELYHRPQIPQSVMEGYEGGRASARSRAGVWCLELSKLTPSTEADHVIPSRRLPDYEFYDQSNIVGSCRSCNSRRASYEAKGVHFDTFEEWAKFLKKKNAKNINPGT